MSQGVRADPQTDARSLLDTADALLDGGDVPAVQGAGGIVHISAASGDWRITAKLRQERKLISRLVTYGNRLLDTRINDPAYPARLMRLRIIGAQLSSLTSDTVGQMTVDAQASLGRLVNVGIVLGALGALLALLMAFLIRRLRDQQLARFRSLVQNSNDLITVIGPLSTIVYQSTASSRLLGRTSESLIGARFEDLVHPEDRLSYGRFIEALEGAAGSTLETEVRLMSLAGLWREMHLIGVNLLADRTVRGLVLTSRDVTDGRTAERALAAIQTERSRLLDRTVEASEQERTRLAADLHDGPVQHLAAMEVRLQALRDRLPEGEVHTSASVDRVQVSLRTQVQALRSLMTELRPPALDERGLGAALRDHLAAVQRRSGLACRVESTINRRLEPTYETLLYRVAQEGLTNAVKHARAHEVWVRLHEDGDAVVLEVADDGVGFDPTTAHTSNAGAHFGLIGMRERVEMAGGTWSIQSVPGAGTKITARLPLRTESPSTQGRPPSILQQVDVRGVELMLARPTVLIADDEEVMRSALIELLDGEELHVVGEAGDGSEPWRSRSRLDPDVVLMDLRMPLMDGIEAAERIKRQMPFVQVVMYSAYADLALEEASQAAGVYCYPHRRAHRRSSSGTS